MILETKGLCKQFGNMYALKDIDFSIKEGEIHGLVGENGAGKSTLIKILTGVYHLDKGEIFVEGKKVIITDPAQSRELGINVIHQDRNLIPIFNGVENIYLGLKSETKNLCFVDFKKMKEKIVKVMKEYGIDVPLDKMAKELSSPQKTLFEITRAMMTECKLLILDEPTASLTDKETKILFDIIKKLNEKGTAILYITHRMDEIFQLTNRITVFKNGELVKTVNKNEIDKDGLISLMTDKWTRSKVKEKKSDFGKVIYEVKNIASDNKVVKDVSFKVREREILGIFGLGGSGRTELLEAIYGFEKVSSGEIYLEDKKLEKINTTNSLKNGVVLINEDRRGKSLISTRSVKDNIVLSTIDNYVKKGIYNAKKEKEDAENKVKELKIKTSSINQPTGELSGGNQQKVVFAKALMSNPKIFLCDEPTQAVDVKTREEIHKLLRECADKGSAVVFVTSDLKEMLDVADNILIMAQGRTWELIPNEDITSEQILKYCYLERNLKNGNN
ncbi:MAG: sugar ABC transporter ATP-binding protein [Clostridia bacterium]